jgi:uncharacterized membrane protein YphA (DoxX/SURF4 family)
MLGLFFILNGVNHLFNTQIVEEYAHKRGLISPRLMVYLSGALLIFGGLTLMTGFFKIYGIIGLSIFLVVAAFTIHQFWAETDRNMRMMEAMHFSKNMAILTELIYIAVG